MKHESKKLFRKAICLVLCLGMLAQTGLTAFAAERQENTAPEAPTGMLMDLMEQPFGISTENPSMSWIVNDADANEVQTAYQILVADSQAKIDADQGNIWDSGKVESNESSNAQYAGPALEASTTYYWKVRTWDKDDAVSPWSEAQRFSTAVDNWTADAIWVGSSSQGDDNETVFERMGWKNYDIECKFGITSKALGFCFYMDNSEKNCYMWQVSSDKDQLIPHVFKNGVASPQNSAEAADVTYDIGTIDDNTEYTMKLSIRDSVVTTYINGEKVNTFDLGEHEYALYNGGSFGFRTGGSESGWIDDLKITNEAGVVVYQNDFSEATSEFGNGTVSDGKLVIGKSGRAYYTVSDNIFTNAGWYDYDLECDFGVTAKALGFSFYTDNSENNCYMWQIRADRNVLCPHIFVNGKANVDTSADGSSDISLENYGVTVGLNETHKLKLSLRGKTVTTYVDGVQVDTREMGEYSYGSIGFRCGGSESGWVDNVTVTNKYGTVVYSDDFESGKNDYTSGTVSDGKLVINLGNKAYYAVSENQTGDQPAVEPRGNVFFARKDFTVPEGKTVDSAVVNVTALYSGFKGSASVNTRQWVFRMYVNGEYVGIGPHMDSSQGKGAGDYYYNSFDVTNHLQEGENTIGAICYALQDRRFQAQLKVTYTDGTSDVYVTDNTWKTLDGTAAYGEGEASIGTSAYFTAMAENIDARVFPYGWDEPGFDDSKWTAPVVKERITNLIPTPTDPVLENEVQPAKIVDKGNGSFFIDMGVELVGGIRLTLDLEGVSGTDLTVMYGEELSGENSVRWQMRTGNNYREFWTLTDGQQVFEPFGMKNFRYVEIQGCPESITKEVLENSLVGVSMYQKFDESESYFVSDNELLNDIYQFAKDSIRVTTQDLFVDSQSRERGPYEGDAYVNQLTSYSFSRNYTVARFTNEFMAYHPEWCTEYQQENAMSFYQDYLYTGNTNSVTNFYEKIKTKVLSSKYDSSVQMIKTNTSNDLVDWPAGERDGYTVGTANPYNTVINAFNYQAAVNVAEIAKVLGKTEDAEYYTTLAANLKEGINQLYNAETGNMMEGRNADGSIRTAEPQHANFFPVSLGAVTDADKLATISESLANDGIKCSVYATQFLFTAMYEAGDAQGALDMLNSKGTRSYYHLLKELGVTIAPEAWDPSLKSNMTYSHAWGSAPGNVIVRNLCGIQPLEAGYSKAEIKPAIASLETVSVKVPNIKGYIYMDIDTSKSGYVTDMSVTLPANTTAKVYVPAENTGTDLLIVDGVSTTATREGDYLVVDNVGSGKHTFQVPVAMKMTASVENSVNYVGHSKQIQVSVLDSNSQPVSLDQAVLTYVSSNDQVVSVDEKGNVSFVGEGTATVTVTATFTNVEIMGTVIPSMVLESTVRFETTTPEITGSVLKSVKTGNRELQLTLFEHYSDGTEVAVDASQVQFSSSDKTVATVDATGKVTQLKNGKVTFKAQVGGEVLFFDDFDNADNFSGTSAANGELSVGKSKNVFYQGGKSWSNYVVETTGKATANAWSLTFYATDTSNYYLWQINEKEGNVLKPHYFLNGSVTQLDTVKLGDEYKAGEYNTMRVEVVDGTIKTYVNDVLVYTVKDSTLSQGSVGFRNGGSETNNYQYIRVSTPVQTAELDVDLGKPDVTVNLAGETEATVDADSLTYTVSLKGAKDLATATVKFAISGQVQAPVMEALNGFYIVGTKTENVDGKMVCVVTLGKNDGLTSEEAVDILSVTLTPTGKAGQATVTMTKVVLSAFDGDAYETYVNAVLETDSVTTQMKYSRYDVNHDGIVDQLDMTRIQRFYGLESSDEGFYADADVDGNGVIDINDMILVLNNYTEE